MTTLKTPYLIITMICLIGSSQMRDFTNMMRYHNLEIRYITEEVKIGY